MTHVDVLVIGAGLVGSATAWHLARGGASVLVVEAGHANIGASGQNAGSLHFQIERRFLENGDKLALEGSRIAALSRLAVDEWRGLEAALGQDLHVTQNGGFMVAETPAQIDVLALKVEREQSAGLRTMLLDGDEARAQAPYLSPNVIAAGFLPDEGHADPRSVTPAFLDAARRSGANIRQMTRVDHLSATRPGFRAGLRDDDGTDIVTADRVLLATGAWTPRLGAMLNLHLPLFPVGLSMNATERVAPFLPHLIQHVGRRLSMKQTHSGNVLIGGGWPARLQRDASGAFDPGQRPEPIEASRRDNLVAAIATIPRVAEMNLLRSWTGVTAITSDQLPLVGEVPRMPGLFVAAGGSAFTLGPTYARLISQQILETDRADADDALSILSPARFEHLNGFMG